MKFPWECLGNLTTLFIETHCRYTQSPSLPKSCLFKDLPQDAVPPCGHIRGAKPVRQDAQLTEFCMGCVVPRIAHFVQNLENVKERKKEKMRCLCFTERRQIRSVTFEVKKLGAVFGPLAKWYERVRLRGVPKELGLGLGRVTTMQVSYLPLASRSLPVLSLS